LADDALALSDSLWSGQENAKSGAAPGESYLPMGVFCEGKP
jgi:hypothetical protein